MATLSKPYTTVPVIVRSLEEYSKLADLLQENGIEYGQLDEMDKRKWSCSICGFEVRDHLGPDGTICPVEIDKTEE